MRDDYARSFTSHIPLCIEIPEFRCSIDQRHPVHMNSSFSQEFAQEHCTLLQKWIEVRFWFQATISAPYAKEWAYQGPSVEFFNCVSWKASPWQFIWRWNCCWKSKSNFLPLLQQCDCRLWWV